MSVGTELSDSETELLMLMRRNSRHTDNLSITRSVMARSHPTVREMGHETMGYSKIKSLVYYVLRGISYIVNLNI